MKKFIIAFALVAITTLSVEAQTTPAKKTTFSIGIDGGAPFGEDAETFSLALGGSVQAAKRVSTNIELLGNLGYQVYTRDKSHFPTNAVPEGMKLIIPSFGFRYFLAKSFYAQAQIGPALGINKGGTTSLFYSPRIGGQFGKIDVNAGLQGLNKGSSTISALMMRIAYNLN